MQHLKVFIVLSLITVVCLFFVTGPSLHSSNYGANKIEIDIYDDNLLEPANKTISIEPIGPLKPGNKWIVVTSINNPSNDLIRLSSFPDWNSVVVADTKTPKNWSLDGVHFLSVDYQKTLPLKTVSLLPFKSYTRKNIGYLYAIAQGAEWIYDTDDDNKPYGLGLNQFDYDPQVSGVRYKVKRSDPLRNKLFNPYRFYGRADMWPRGFPLEYLKNHTNGNDRMIHCSRMKRAAVQQGLVHHDPDVDAIYRLKHADPQTGLNERFNKFAPPITLSPGTYAPWNSQNTLFHKSAFHTLFLPITVSFRTTDIWRSYYAQKVLHLSGLSVSFTPVTAVQYRNAHDYKKDFDDEKQVYKEAGKLADFIDSWECSQNSSSNTVECMKELAQRFVFEKFWGAEDAELINIFIKDLQSLGFAFPRLMNQKITDSQYQTQTDESSRDVNCRRVRLDFELDCPEQNEQPAVQRADMKVKHFSDITNWCDEAGYKIQSNSTPYSVNKIAEDHSKNQVLTTNLDNVLIITNNYEWKMSIGLLQRLYQPYFGHLIFCGSFYPDTYKDNNFPRILDSFSYIHLNPAEVHRGFFIYHCLTLVKQMKLANVNGYFMVSDDAHFNIWQKIDFKRVFHLQGVNWMGSNGWWKSPFGLESAKKIVEHVESSNDQKVLATWKKYEKGLQSFGYIDSSQSASEDMTREMTGAISDFFYVPSHELEYYADLSSIFYKFQLFLEIAIHKFIRSVKHQTSLHRGDSYLWEDGRKHWPSLYSADFVGFHPVKLSAFSEPGEERILYCSTIIQTWNNILFDGSKNYKIKEDNEADWMNG